MPAWLKGEEEEGQEANGGFNRRSDGMKSRLKAAKRGAIRPSITLICLSDALTSAAIFSSLGAPLDVRRGV